MIHLELDAPVEKFMRRSLYILQPEDTCDKAARVMKEHDVGSVLVGRDEGPIGIVTERDMLKKVLGEGLHPSEVRLKDVMSTPVVSISPKAAVREALELMAHHGFRRLLVVDDERPVGLIAQRFTIREEVDFLMNRAFKPAKDAMRYHPFYRGKVELNLKVPVKSFDDFAVWYTPGVAEPCKDVQRNAERVYDHTNKGNSVAIVTDGSRVLGLGDIGPHAALPVMEGKALLFRYLGGVDAYPICLKTYDPEEIVQAVKWLQPAFGAINLEDIAQPKCFYILDRLRKEAEIPVWHDDQQGTATVVLAGVINALKVVGKKMGEVSVSMIGAGASNIRTAHLFIEAGFRPGNIIMVDSKGILHRGREDLQDSHPQKWEMCLNTNSEGRVGGIHEAMVDADIVVALSTPGPGVVKVEDVKAMATDPIVFACANPIPEIWPWDARVAGAAVVATGRSDFPNQVNNSLGFPGIFRGALDVRARTITDEMCLAAAKELALIAEEKGLASDHILPTMEQWEVFPREAVAVGMMAQKQGVAGRKVGESRLYEEAHDRIKRARDIVRLCMDEGFIKEPPPEETVIYGA
ncbi:MAG: malic enzyme-like NAD(P)-binding protein [Thermoplasmata archaeon]